VNQDMNQDNIGDAGEMNLEVDSRDEVICDFREEIKPMQAMGPQEV